MEPAFAVDAFCCEVWTLVISQHHIGSFAAYFPVFSELDSNIADDFSYGTKAPATGIKAVHTDHGRGLGETISFHHHYFGSSENTKQTHLTGCSACYNSPDITSKAFPPFGENEFIGDGQLDVVEHPQVFIYFILITYRNCPKEQCFLQPCQLPSFANDSFVNLLKESRYRREEAGLHFPEVISNGIKAFCIVYGNTSVHINIADHPFKDVVEREEA